MYPLRDPFHIRVRPREWGHDTLLPLLSFPGPYLLKGNCDFFFNQIIKLNFILCLTFKILNIKNF